MAQLAAITGADVAASSDLTGAARLGGDWQLELVQGTVAADAALNAGLLADYAQLLGAADANFDSDPMVNHDGVASATYDGWTFGVSSGTTEFVNAGNDDYPNPFSILHGGRCIIGNYLGNSGI